MTDGTMAAATPHGESWLDLRGRTAYDDMERCDLLDAGRDAVCKLTVLAELTTYDDPLSTYGCADGVHLIITEAIDALSALLRSLDRTA